MPQVGEKEGILFFDGLSKPPRSGEAGTQQTIKCARIERGLPALFEIMSLLRQGMRDGLHGAAIEFASDFAADSRGRVENRHARSNQAGYHQIADDDRAFKPRALQESLEEQSQT